MANTVTQRQWFLITYTKNGFTAVIMLAHNLEQVTAIYNRLDFPYDVKALTYQDLENMLGCKQGTIKPESLAVEPSVFVKGVEKEFLIAIAD